MIRAIFPYDMKGSNSGENSKIPRLETIYTINWTLKVEIMAVEVKKPRTLFCLLQSITARTIKAAKSAMIAKSVILLKAFYQSCFTILLPQF